MRSASEVVSRWWLATKSMLPLLTVEKKTQFLEYVLQDEDSRSYLLNKLTPDIIKCLTQPTNTPLDDDDVVLIEQWDGKVSQHAYMMFNDLPWRIKFIVECLWTPTNYMFTIDKNDDTDNEFVRMYLSCLERQVLENCIPVWEDPDEHDISDFAQPGTVLYDAYVYGAVDNEDSVIEKVQQGLQRLYEFELEDSPIATYWSPTKRWMRSPRVKMYLT